MPRRPWRPRFRTTEDDSVNLIQWTLTLATATVLGLLVTGAVAWWILFS